MADFVPPPGPPPPKVPEGWKAQWNDQYKEWFYVNIYTKQSQWEKPTEPVYPASHGDSAPSGAPPGYASGGQAPLGDVKANPYETETRSGHMGGSASPNNEEEDRKLASKLQAEEDARAQQATRGNAMQDYMQTPMPQASPQPLPKEEKRGLFSKLMGKSHNQHPQYQQQPPQQYGQPQYGGYPPQHGGYAPQGYGGYPPQGYGGYPPQGYGGYPPQGYGGGGYPPQGYAQQAPQKSGGGLGLAGGAALGLGGGLVGGMLLENAIQDHDQSEYNQGYDAGQDNNGGGGDYGGGDGGGGDYGGGDGGF